MAAKIRRVKGVHQTQQHAKRDGDKRKLIGFDEDVYAALRLLARDRAQSFQELADEAFADVLKKHNRPVVLEDALRQSLRAIPANDRVRRRPGR